MPDLRRLRSISPNPISRCATLMASLAKALDVKIRDGIALAVSEADGCDYCVAAHSFTAGNLAKIPSDEIELIREGRSRDPKRQAAATFAKALKVSDGQCAAVKNAGWTGANIVEMIALTAQFLLTNFLNNAVQTPIVFPRSVLRRQA